MSIISASMSDRRRDVEHRLETIRAARGVAMLDGVNFDSQPLQSLECELEAITAAEGEASRREREATGKAEEARLKELRALLAQAEDRRLDAVERAEKAAHAYVAATKEVLDTSADIARISHGLGVNSTHHSAYEAELRLSLRLVCAMKPLTALRGAFGQIRLPAARAPYYDPWREAEAAIVKPALIEAIKETHE